MHDTKVKKGWDCIVIPDGSRIGGLLVSIYAYNYILIEEIKQGKKWRIGFEDFTEELGYDYAVDYDYDDPLLEIELIKARQRLIKGVRFEGIYRHGLLSMRIFETDLRKLW